VTRFHYRYPPPLSRRALRATVAILLLAIVAGCGSPGAKQASDVKSSRLYWLMKVRTHALSQGQTLNSQDDYKRYIRNLDPEGRDAIMKGTGISNVDELFVSERDGQPYVFFYGRRPASVAADLVAYERTGVDGERYVGFGLGVVEEVDEQRFNELVPPTVRPAQ